MSADPPKLLLPACQQPEQLHTDVDRFALPLLSSSPLQEFARLKVFFFKVLENGIKRNVCVDAKTNQNQNKINVGN